MDKKIDVSGGQESQNLYRPEEVAWTSDYTSATDAPLASLVTENPKLPSEPTAGPQSSPTMPEVLSTDAPSDTGIITWTAKDFVERQLPTSWYGALGVGAIVIAAVIWLLTRDLFPAGTVFIGILLLGVYASRRPHEESYAMDFQGITIGNRRYGYQDFRSFTVVPEGSLLTVELAPLKRFATYTTLYFTPNDSERILKRLSSYIPHEEARANMTDSLVRRIRL